MGSLRHINQLTVLYSTTMIKPGMTVDKKQAATDCQVTQAYSTMGTLGGIS